MYNSQRRKLCLCPDGEIYTHQKRNQNTHNPKTTTTRRQPPARRCHPQSQLEGRRQKKRGPPPRHQGRSGELEENAHCCPQHRSPASWGWGKGVGVEWSVGPRSSLECRRKKAETGASGRDSSCLSPWPLPPPTPFPFPRGFFPSPQGLPFLGRRGLLPAFILDLLSKLKIQKSRGRGANSLLG